MEKKYFAFLGMVLMVVFMSVGFAACSSDDDDSSYSSLIVGDWTDKADGSSNYIMHFYKDGTFMDAELRDGREIQYIVGTYKIEGDFLKVKDRDETEWSINKILKIDSNSMTLEFYDEEDSPSGFVHTYYRVKALKQ